MGTMRSLQILFLLVYMERCIQGEVVTNTTLPASFQKIGYLCEDLQYAHLHTVIDTKIMKNLLGDAKMAANASLAKINFISGRNVTIKLNPFYQAVEKSLAPSERLMEMIDLMFPPNSTYYAEVDGQLIVTRDTYNVKSERDIAADREKRQILIGAVASGVLLNMGLSIYNNYEINQLRREVDRLNKGTDHIITALKEKDLAVKTLTEAVVTFNSTMIEYADDISRLSNEFSIIAAYSLLHTQIETGTQELSLLAEGLMSLPKGVLSPTLVDKSKIVNAVEDLNSKAKSQGYHLLHAEPSSIFKNEISYITEGSKIHIFVHCPIIKLEPFPLYKYLEAPLILHDDGDDENKPLMFVKSPENNQYLAISNQGRQGMEFTPDFLAGCTTDKIALGTVYLCHHGISILKNQIADSCLGMLFSGNYDQTQLTKKCNIVFEDLDEYSKQIDSQSFLLYSRKPIKLTKICSSPPSTNITMVKGLQVIKVESSCYGFTEGYTFYGKTDLTISTDFVYLPKLILFSESVFPAINLAGIYQKLKGLELPKQVDFRTLNNWAQTGTWRWHAGWTGGFLVTFNIIMSVGIVSYLAFTYWRFHRARQVGQPEQGEAQEMDRLA